VKINTNVIDLGEKEAGLFQEVIDIHLYENLSFLYTTGSHQVLLQKKIDLER